MPIYDKPVRVLLTDMMKELKFYEGEIVKETKIQSWFQANYPKINSRTVSAHLTKMTTNARSRVWHKVDPAGSHDIFFKTSTGSYRLYDKASDPAPIYRKDDVLHSSPPTHQQVSAPVEYSGLSRIPSDNELDERRRAVVKMLKTLDKSDENPAAQLGRLKRTNLIPRHIASLIFVILEYRNILVYEDYHIVKTNEALAVNAAWAVVEEWSKTEILLK